AGYHPPPCGAPGIDGGQPWLRLPARRLRCLDVRADPRGARGQARADEPSTVGGQVPVPERVAMLSVHTSPLDQPGTGDAGGMNVYVVELARRLAALGI